LAERLLSSIWLKSLGMVLPRGGQNRQAWWALMTNA
jgi:hypothetical protein